MASSLLRSASLVFIKRAVAVGLLAVAADNACAYVLSGPKWPADSTVTFQLSLGSASRMLSDGNTSWDAAAAPVFIAWNQSLLHVQFIGRISSSSVSSGDGINTVTFATSVFGQAFGSNTVAVTYYRYSSSLMSEADVLFNVDQAFDSYRGPLQFGANGFVVADIQRVLIHELGHALGLNHPDQNGQQVDAIMNSIISNREIPSGDDLAGAQLLYGTRIPMPAQITSATLTGNGHILLQCVGLPNVANRIDASDKPNGPFSTLTTISADGGGRFQVEDSGPAAFQRRFYRMEYP